jgi:hypothetical protein
LLQVAPAVAYGMIVWQAYIDGNIAVALVLVVAFVLCCGSAILWRLIRP